VTLERILPPTFARVHRSYIANLEQVRALRPTEGRPVLSMRDGTSIPVGRRYARLLRARLANDTDL